MKQLPRALQRNEEFMRWYNGRPAKVQALIRLRPPHRDYRLQEGAFPASIYSYDEEEGGDVTMQVDVHSPLMPRRVFGVKPRHLILWRKRK